MRSMAPGTRGEDVRDVQARLTSLGYRTEPDDAGVYGPATEAAVRAFQQARNLIVDGVTGAGTWQELVEAGYALGDRVLYVRYPYVRGDDVRELQSRLNALGFDPGREDGIFGEHTDTAVREFQRNVGLPPDGIVGGTTVEALARLRPASAGGPGRIDVREREALRSRSGSLAEALVAVDASRSGGAPAAGPTGLEADDAAYALARAACAALEARGARILMLWSFGDHPTDRERARAANAAGADLVVSVAVNAHADPRAEGSTTFYAGRAGWASVPGQRLAELIQDELVGSLGLTDGRAHPMWLPLLRETRMPAVHVEPCFVTNPREERLLRTEAFRQAVGRAIARAVDRFLGARSAAEPAAG